MYYKNVESLFVFFFLILAKKDIYITLLSYV